MTITTIETIPRKSAVQPSVLFASTTLIGPQKLSLELLDRIMRDSLGFGQTGIGWRSQVASHTLFFRSTHDEVRTANYCSKNDLVLAGADLFAGTPLG